MSDAMPGANDLTGQIHPDFFTRMQALLGDDYAAFEACYSGNAHSGLRVNTLKLSAEAYQSISPFPITPIPWCPSGFNTPGDSQTGKHPYHAAGLYYIQEPSAMAAAEILAPLTGDRVLDLSAAPGGKTTHLACLMQDRGILLANEIHPTRVWDLAENLERCGVRNALVTNETAERLAAHFGPFFDRVLLDAPCSGEGMFRKSESARKHWNPSLVRGCALRQQAILPVAASLVRPGGCLVYSTCTFSPEENEAVIASFLDRHPDFTLSPPLAHHRFSSGKPDWAEVSSHHPLESAVRIWPHQSTGEGAFIARLQKVGQAGASSDRPPHHRPGSNSLPAPFLRHYQQFLADAVTSGDLSSRLSLSGTYLYQLPSELPGLAGLKVIRPGWWLGTFKKERFEPSHALALGMTADQAARIHRLSAHEPEVLAYLRGESLPSAGPDGWTLIAVDGFPLGWGKRVQGVLKNAYPRGLRWA